jgi:predicted O-linked N-acetylglucosamine transferase (SPINDLY family)
MRSSALCDGKAFAHALENTFKGLMAKNEF